MLEIEQFLFDIEYLTKREGVFIRSRAFYRIDMVYEKISLSISADRYRIYPTIRRGFCPSKMTSNN